jgi:hypothetical protein
MVVLILGNALVFSSYEDVSKSFLFEKNPPFFFFLIECWSSNQLPTAQVTLRTEFRGDFDIHETKYF